MDEESAFAATYSDWKVIRGRKVVQIVLEVPLEKSHLAYAVLGGMPNPAEETWVGVAQLKKVPSLQTKEAIDSGSIKAKTALIHGTSARSLYGNAAAKLRGRADYQDFIFGVADIILGRNNFVVATEPVARKQFVAMLQHEWCGVESMADIEAGSVAEERWDVLSEAFYADTHDVGVSPREILTDALARLGDQCQTNHVLSESKSP